MFHNNTTKGMYILIEVVVVCNTNHKWNVWKKKVEKIELKKIRM